MQIIPCGSPPFVPPWLDPPFNIVLPVMPDGYREPDDIYLPVEPSCTRRTPRCIQGPDTLRRM